MAQVKFGRNYKLIIQKPNGDFLQIGLPFTIEFDLTRGSLGSINSCQIRIYNLSPTNRKDLRLDWSNYSIKRTIQLNAGYGDNLPLVFFGTISQASSYREGEDYITTIDCQDGALAASNSLIPANGGNFSAGTSMQTVYKTLMGYLDFVTFGQIGDSFIYKNGNLQVLQRSNSYTGNVMQNLIKLSGNAFYIDNGKSYILTNEEFIKTLGKIPIINNATGLLNTPLIQVQIVSLDMIFEPSLFVGQQIQLQSQSTPYLNNVTINSQQNNYYKITSIKHKCMISPTVCGDAISTVQFYPVNSPI